MVESTCKRQGEGVMRVSIEHSERTTGFFSKKTLYDVMVKVEFSEEEQAIIKKRDLKDAIIVERKASAGREADVEKMGLHDAVHLKIWHLLNGKGNAHSFHTPQDAKAYEAKVKEAMPKLKSYIMDNETIENTSTSFEL